MPAQYGGSADAIRHHYDVGNNFYSNWLDRTMTYSCAMWDKIPIESSLEAAQENKLQYHSHNVRASQCSHILDVGCGWGSMLTAIAATNPEAHRVGLTLSHAQHEYVRSLNIRNTEIKLESWVDYTPLMPHDGIISIGAFEHFADPSQSRAERVGVYKNFFERCRSWLTPDGRLSLQTIAYGTLHPEQSNVFMKESIFPNAELPYLADILNACEPLFEVLSVRNDRFDYARTCEEWARRLRNAVREGKVANDNLYKAYDRYLRLSAAGFRMGKIVLLRIVLAVPNWNGARP